MTGHPNCISEEQERIIFSDLVKNVDSLRQAGHFELRSSAVTLFRYPVQKAPGLQWNNCIAISGYVDMQNGSGILDYNCGDRTYDGHQGIDIFTWPFPFYLMEYNLVHVVAAASGTIIGKYDGNYSYNCVWNNQNWNAVYIQHADGSVAWYGHMKEGTLTDKNVGQTVQVGEYLGVVGSSGISTGPHLHFQVFSSLNGPLIDPYSGNCNTLNGNSWWISQEDYRVPTLNAVLTHAAPPQFGCPQTEENPHLSDHFSPGEVIYFATYYRDLMAGMPINLKIRKPDGSVWQEWSASSNTTYNAAYWWWDHQLPSNGPFGQWTWEATYNGHTESHHFYYSSGSNDCHIGCPADISYTLSSGECSAVVTYDVPLTGDCGSAQLVQTAGLPSGSEFPVGTTTNTFQLIINGNVIDQCSFDVHVISPSVDLACIGELHIPVDENCTAVVTADMALEGGPYGCPDAYVVRLSASPGGPFDLENTLSCENVDQVMYYRITDTHTGNSCWGQLIVEDKTPPTVECDCNSCQISHDQLDELMNAETAGDLVDLGFELPGVTDNCLQSACPDVTYGVSTGNFDGDICNGGEIDVTWIITDAGGNNAGCTFTVDVITPGITAEIIPQHTTCGLDNGSATAIVPGGSGVYAYTWSNGGTTQTLDNLPAGFYSVTVADENGCTGIAGAIVNSSAGISVAVDVTHESCADCHNGSVTANPAGGNGYTYEWSNGGTTQTISNLAPGQYTVTVTSAGGCVAVTGAFVEAFGCNGITFDTLIHNALCFGDNGSATLVPLNGEAPYAYQWSTGDSTATIAAPAGIYEVTVIDAKGCVGGAAIEIQQPAQLTVLVIATGESCFQACDGHATVTVAGGTGSYDLIWDTGQTGTDLAGLCPGTYMLTVTDANACSTLSSAVIESAQEIYLYIEGDTVICFGSSGTIAATEGFESYMWNTGDTTRSITWDLSGMYTVTVTDADDCKATQSVTVLVDDELDADISRSGDTLTAIASGGFEPYSYIWNTGDTTRSIVPVVNGTYAVTITDEYGCEHIQAYDFTLSFKKPAFSFTAYPNPTNGRINIVLDHSYIDKIRIINSLGKEVYVLRDIGRPSTAVRVESLHPGMYVILVETPLGIFAQKVFKE